MIDGKTIELSNVPMEINWSWFKQSDKHDKKRIYVFDLNLFVHFANQKRQCQWKWIRHAINVICKFDSRKKSIWISQHCVTLSAIDWWKWFEIKTWQTLLWVSILECLSMQPHPWITNTIHGIYFTELVSNVPFDSALT